MNRTLIVFSALVVLIVLFVFGLVVGHAETGTDALLLWLSGGQLSQTDDFILKQVRLPQTLMAIGAGASLSLSGLLMQTYFRNELAGPSVLGISSGASLGVAVVILASAGLCKWGIAAGAISGALVTLCLVMAVSKLFRESGTLLIFGLMISYLAGAVVSILESGADTGVLKSFVQWGFGSFAVRSADEPIWVISMLGLGLLILLPSYRWLNVLVAGDTVARALGAPVGRVSLSLMLATGIMTGVVTAFCGPVAFLGLAVPHLVRGALRTADHSVVLPGVLLTGAALGMLCDVIVRAEPAGLILPLNAITCLIGAPVVIRILIRNAKMKSLI